MYSVTKIIRVKSKTKVLNRKMLDCKKAVSKHLAVLDVSCF